MHMENEWFAHRFFLDAILKYSNILKLFFGKKKSAELWVEFYEEKKINLHHHFVFCVLNN